MKGVLFIEREKTMALNRLRMRQFAKQTKRNAGDSLKPGVFTFLNHSIQFLFISIEKFFATGTITMT